jgi:hypothetical protein
MATEDNVVNGISFSVHGERDGVFLKKEIW